MLQGPNVEATAEIVHAAHASPVIASGGVTTLDDLARPAATGVEGAIVGRALYGGRIDLKEAIDRFERGGG
ncbi:MAG: HisA/HisF-related TIM barrel protein [Gemmataceae bacterium]